MGEHLNQLAGLATVGEKQADVLSGHNTQIAMQRVGGIQKEGHEPD